MRHPILNGEAVILIDDDCATGIEFPNWGSPDNVTEPFTISFVPCKTIEFATNVAQVVLGLA